MIEIKKVEEIKMKLTQSDVDKIKEEIEHRKLVVRKEAIEAVKEARAQGDLSENFEYYAAKKDKNKNEGRIRYHEKYQKTEKINKYARGFMIESYLEDGRQDTPEIYGKSITDPCLGWDNTEQLIREIHATLSK